MEKGLVKRVVFLREKFLTGIYPPDDSYARDIDSNFHRKYAMILSFKFSRICQLSQFLAHAWNHNSVIWTRPGGYFRQTTFRIHENQKTGTDFYNWTLPVFTSPKLFWREYVLAWHLNNLIAIFVPLIDILFCHYISPSFCLGYTYARSSVRLKARMGRL
jgi:hypothetical protein